MDPFKLLNLDYEYEINNLEEYYYKAFKSSSEHALYNINQAYIFLKKPMLRLKFLCKHYGHSKKIELLNVIFKIKQFPKEKQDKIKLSIKKKLGIYIKIKKWEKINVIIQFLEYLDN